MSYLLLFLIALVVVIIVLLRTAKSRKLVRSQMLISGWGQPKSADFNFNHICRHAVITKTDRERQLSERVLSDCNFYDVFPIIDRTTSNIGQQYLFTKLVRPATSRQPLDEFNRHVEFFRENESGRTRIREELSKLDKSDAYFVSSLLKERLLEKPWWFNFAYLNVALLITFAILSFSNPVLAAVALIPLVFNFLIHYWNKFNTYIFLKSLPQLSILIDVSHNIATAYKTNERDAAVASINALRPFQSRLMLLNTSSEGSIRDDLSLIASYFVELLKATFLLEFFLLYDTVKEVEGKRHHVNVLFNFAGGIDAALSVASLRCSHYALCVPQLEDSGKEFLVREIYNPLIKNCTKNDLHLNGKSALITGSNMSGKTTFLRTILLNSILAQTIYTCFASQFKSAILQHFSSIQIGDDILEGKSYYFEEVNVMKDLLDAVNPLDHNLFILDEVFKGTNTIERISAAKAILSYLNRYHNIVFVATHDIELVERLSKEYDLYHFIETLQENDFRFDHKIKPGPLRSGNAIRILELFHYPTEVIKEARNIVATLESDSFLSSSREQNERVYKSE
jgi:hypothetical protein